MKVKVWCDPCKDLKEAKDLTIDSDHMHLTLVCGHGVTLTGFKLSQGIVWLKGDHT